MGDEVSDAFDAVRRRWAERQGVFERRTIRRELELVVMPGQDARAQGGETSRRPESVRPTIREIRDHLRGLHAVWCWVRTVVEFVPVDESGRCRGAPGAPAGGNGHRRWRAWAQRADMPSRRCCLPASLSASVCLHIYDDRRPHHRWFISANNPMLIAAATP
jgi:hypothetical protein